MAYRPALVFAAGAAVSAALALTFIGGAAASHQHCNLTIYQPYRSNYTYATTRFVVNACTGVVRATVWAKLYRNGTSTGSGHVYTGYPAGDYRFTDACWTDPGDFTERYKGWGRLTVYNSGGGSGANEDFGNFRDLFCNAVAMPFSVMATMAFSAGAPTVFPVDDGVGVTLTAEIPD